MTDFSKRIEYLVVGSGPGGAVSAYHLSKAGREVLIVEEGRSIAPNPDDTYGINDMLNKYRNGGLTVMLGKPKVSYVEGKLVGGGSEVNSGLYHRAPDYVFENWRTRYNVQGLEAGVINPFYEDAERMTSISPLSQPASKASLKLQDGADRLGWNAMAVPRWFSPSGSGEKRNSMSQTYLPQAITSGAKLLTEARVLSFERSSNGWVVKIRSHGKTLAITTEHLILSAGAVQTPSLLRRSGITCNIGNSLKIHPTMKLVGSFPEAINHRGMGVPVHQVKEFSPKMTFGGSISSKSFLGMALLDHPSKFQHLIEKWQNLAVYYAAIDTQVSGKIRNVPGFDDPLVRYQIGNKEMQTISEGIQKLGQLLFEAGATELFPTAVKSQAIRSPRELVLKLKMNQLQLMTIHLFSSCPMGEETAICAADSFGRVHGQKNLYINDASLLCSAPGVNPQGMIMAIAARNATAWLGKL